MRLYLASTSPARLMTLRAVGIEPFVVPSSVDEDAAVAEWEQANGPLGAEDMVQLLAKAKAEAVAGSLVDDHPIDGLILGGDSAFELDGRIYGKPHHPQIARERWMQQRGRTGHLHSGHWLIDHRGGAMNGARGAVTTTSVTFADDITDDEVDAYIATGEPLEVAGAFTIDSRGAAFIREIVGDPHAVVGLSVATVRTLVGGFGIAWPDLWNRG